jgi:hypothetical protein
MFVITTLVGYSLDIQVPHSFASSLAARCVAI